MQWWVYFFSSSARWVFYLVWHFTKTYTQADEDMLVKHDLAQIFNWLEIPPREVKNMQKKVINIKLHIMSIVFLNGFGKSDN